MSDQIQVKADQLDNHLNKMNRTLDRIERSETNSNLRLGNIESKLDNLREETQNGFRKTNDHLEDIKYNPKCWISTT